MVNWRSPEVEIRCQEMYIRLVSFLVGLYFYYFCLSLPAVEIPLIRRRLKFALAHIPYLLGRYCALTGAIFLAMILQEEYSAFCAHLSKAFPLLSSLIVACSSTNIMLRPLALFKRNIYVTSILIVLLLGHWGLAFGASMSSVLVKWKITHPAGAQCAGIIPTESHGNYGVISYYFYTVIWDSIILAFTLVGLCHQEPMHSSRLWSTLYNQGVGYLIATMALNIPSLVFSWLNLNGTMNIFFVVPGGIVSVMVSSSVVVSLIRMKDDWDCASLPYCDHSGIQPEAAAKSDPGGLLTTHVVLPPNSVLSEICNQRNHSSV